MEDLLKKQKTEVDELNRLISNYKRDGGDRKHERYLNDKKSTFGEMFRVIKEIDDEIQKLREPKYETQPYFEAKTFEKIDEVFTKVMEDVEKRLEAINQPLDLNSGAKTTVSTATTPVNFSSTSSTTKQNGTGAQLDAPGASHDIIQLNNTFDRQTNGQNNGNNDEENGHGKKMALLMTFRATIQTK